MYLNEICILDVKEVNTHDGIVTYIWKFSIYLVVVNKT